MEDAQNRENIENINKYIKLAPLLPGGEPARVQSPITPIKRHFFKSIQEAFKFISPTPEI